MPKPDQIYSPQEVAQRTVTAIQGRVDTRGQGVRTGLDELDAVLNPQRPGELRLVVGYTSNYKSGLMSYIARHNARQWAADGSGRVVVTVTWEQSVEEQGAVDISQLMGMSVSAMMRGEMGKDDLLRLVQGAVKRGALPWWVFGHSVQDKERRPRLSLTDVAHLLAYLVDEQHVTPGLIVLDYLQRIRLEGKGELREQYMQAVDRCKDMSLAFGVPVMLGTQSGRKVKERKFKMPQLEDIQETSNGEQSADSVLSVWMPKQDMADGDLFEFGKTTYAVTKGLLMVGVLKQKFGDAPFYTGFNVDHSHGTIEPLKRVKNLGGKP